MSEFSERISSSILEATRTAKKDEKQEPFRSGALRRATERGYQTILWPHERITRASGPSCTPENIERQEFPVGAMNGWLDEMPWILDTPELAIKIQLLMVFLEDLQFYPYPVARHAYYEVMRLYERGEISFEDDFRIWLNSYKDSLNKELSKRPTAIAPAPAPHRPPQQKKKDKPDQDKREYKICTNWNKNKCSHQGDHFNDGSWWLHACGYCFHRRKQRQDDHTEPFCEFKKADKHNGQPKNSRGPR